MNAVSNRVSQTNRFDGMLNVLGILAGQRQGIGGAGNALLVNYDECYSTDGLVSTIVDKPAEDLMATGFTIDGDENNDILNEFDRLDAIPVITDALRWMRLNGGGAILVLLEDGLPLTAPADNNRINRVADLIAYSISQINPTQFRYSDPTQKNYGWPALYELQPPQGQPFLVHESRLIKFGGDPLPAGRTHARGIPWAGRSVIDACYKSVSRYNTFMMLSQGILERKTQLVHKMSDLGTMLAQGLDDVVAKRINMADSARNIFNMLAVDALDDVVLADTSVGGIDAMVRDARIDVASKARMPMSVLFGEQAGGLNANAEGENTIYSKLLEGIQKRKLTPAIELLARFIWSQRALPVKEPERWLIKYNPLFVPRPADVAEVEQKRAATRKTIMEAINIGIESFILLPEEGRRAADLAFPELALDPEVVPLPSDTPGEETAGTRGPAARSVGLAGAATGAASGNGAVGEE